MQVPGLEGYYILVELLISGTWRDITPDVMQANGGIIAIVQGQGDQSSVSQPASCTFVVLNTSGDYTKGPASKWWPFLDQGTTVRVQVLANGTVSPRFQGPARGFTPTWDDSGNLPVVTIQADGISQKLQRDKFVANSPLYRAYQTQPQVVGFWSMEDDANSTQIASALPNGQSIVNLNNVSFAASSVAHPGSKPLVGLGIDTSIGPAVVPAHTFQGHWQVDVQLFLPTGGTVSTGKILSVQSSGTVKAWDIVLGSGGLGVGTIGLDGYSATAQLVNSTNFAIPSFMFNNWSHLRLMVQNNGSTIDWQVVFFPLSGGGSFFSGNLAAAVSGNALGVSPGGLFNTAGNNFSGCFIGQVVVFDGWNLSAVDAARNGWFGEDARGRMARLCGEEGVSFDFSSGSATPSALGNQPIDTFTNIMRDCEKADAGILYDGRDPGWTYRPRTAIYNRHFANMTLDAAASQVGLPVEPTDDDQFRVNRYEASRTNGSKAVFSAEPGPKDVAHIGEYKQGDTFNVSTDNVLLNHAAFRVHKGTPTAPYRYPTLHLDIAAVPSIASNWLGPFVVIGCRFDVLNVNQVRPQHPPGVLNNLMVGYSETLSPFMWTADLVCAPFDPWFVSSLSNGAGSSTHFRLDSATSSLAVGAAAGDLTLSVTGADTALWTTTATFPNDFPILIWCGGWPLLVTGITGSTRPQTFTLDPTTPVPQTINAGTQVKLWQPTPLGL
jgi:hypothetical protein